MQRKNKFFSHEDFENGSNQNTNLVDKNQNSTVIICLDLNKANKLFKFYKQLTAEEKMEKLIETIKDIHNHIKKHDHADQIVICWRETFIFDKHDEKKHSYSISQKFAKKFKSALSTLTQQYQDLKIISGGVLIAKEDVSVDEYREKINSLYKTYEKKFKIEIDRLKDIHIKNQAFTAETIFNNHTNFTKFKNNAYVYYSGVKVRHGKVVPHIECDKEPYENKVLQLGKSNNFDSMIVNIPNSMNLLIHTCREHYFGVANKENVDIHFILSDSIPVFTSKIAKQAKMVIHVDSLNGVSAFKTTNITNDIKVYKYDFLDHKFNIEPVKAIRPLQYKLQNFLDTLIQVPPAINKLINNLPDEADLLPKIIIDIKNQILNLINVSDFDRSDMNIISKICNIIYEHIEEIESYKKYIPYSLLNLIKNDLDHEINQIKQKYKMNASLNKYSNDNNFFNNETNKPADLKLDKKLYAKILLFDDERKQLKAIQKLLSSGANPHYVPDQESSATAYSLAMASKNKDLITLMAPYALPSNTIKYYCNIL